MSKNNLLEVAKLIRYWSVKLPTVAGSGHPTSSASAVELMTALMFGGYFKYDLLNPDNQNNDRLIFSKGHASSLFYSLWFAAGALSEKEMLTYRRFNSVLEGHPTRRFKYTEAATGSLGQGLAIGIGKALASKMDKIKNKVFVLMGDSELAEGSVWEAAQIAGYYQLDNLIAFVDVNRLGQRGETMTAYDLKKIGNRFKAFDWQVIYIKNGNDIIEVNSAYKEALNSKNHGPVVFIAKTVKGFGIPEIAGKDGWHGKPLSLEQWQKIENQLMPKDLNLKAEISGVVISEKKKGSTSYKVGFKNNNEVLSSRFAIGEALASVADNDNLVFIDAEVGNSTGLDKSKSKAKERYLQTYIAEQTMAGIALGVSLSGKKAILATFGAFLTRTFDQLRMAAYNQANITCIGTHAGVAIGEDGSSQMALEDVAMFRAISGSIVLQPADDVSAVALTELALNQKGISYLRALRQTTPRIYKTSSKFKLGGLNILNNFNEGEVVVLASGTTVAEAMKAQAKLKEKNINIGVVDVYSIKPLPERQLLEIAKRASKVVIVEDHYAAGGLGEAVNSVIAGKVKEVINLSVKIVPRSGKSEELIDHAGIGAATIEKNIINK